MLKEIAAKLSKVIRGSGTQGEDKEGASNLNTGLIEKMQAHKGTPGPLYFRGFLGETRGVWNEYGFNIDTLAETHETLAPEASPPASVEGVLDDAVTDVPLITAIREHLESIDYEEVKVNKTKSNKPLGSSVPI